jgi:hypothetical protein
MLSVIMLNVTLPYHFAKCFNIDCRYSEFLSAIITMCNVVRKTNNLPSWSVALKTANTLAYHTKVQLASWPIFLPFRLHERILER